MSDTPLEEAVKEETADDRLEKLKVALRTELTDAGWKEERPGIWRNPKGSLVAGTGRAWSVMDYLRTKYGQKP